MEGRVEVVRNVKQGKVVVGLEDKGSKGLYAVHSKGEINA